MSPHGITQVWVLVLGIALAPEALGTDVQAPGAVLADRVVSVLGESIVTATEVGFEEALHPHVESHIPPLANPDMKALQRLEDMRMLLLLAGDVPLYAPDRTQLDARLAAVRSTWDGEKAYLAFLARWGMTEGDLRSHLRNRMVVESYIHRNVGLSLEWESGQVGWATVYITAYETWITPRRSETRVRRIPAQ
jgi:hypothetical protein